MKILLIFNGKTADRKLSQLIDDYLSRLTHYTPLEVITIPEVKSVKGLSNAVQMQREAESMFKLLQPTDFVVLFDEHGKEMRSMELAEWLQKKQQVLKRLVFIVGGPYGFAPQIKERANEMLSLSKLTFSHQMVRLIIAEQLYRACTILKGEPYHHE